MKTEPTDKWSLIAKKMANEDIPPEDEVLFNDWVTKDQNDELYKIMKSIRLDCDYETALNVRKDVKKNLFAQMLSNGTDNKKNRHIFISVAACIAILVVSSVVYRINFAKGVDNTFVEFYSSSSGAKVVLPDSTVVTLNEDSRIVYDADTYNKEKRTLSLSGEAFFDVRHNADKPFIVNTDNIDVQVLGTTFNVKAYNSEENIVISLISGSVELTDKGKNQMLKLIPGQASSYNKKTTNLSLYTFEKDDVTSWMTPKLFFDRESFSDVCKKLERRFGVSIVLKNKKLENKLLTGRFTNDESLTDILDIMNINEPFRYKIKDDEVTIY